MELWQLHLETCDLRVDERTTGSDSKTSGTTGWCTSIVRGAVSFLYGARVSSGVPGKGQHYRAAGQMRQPALQTLGKRIPAFLRYAVHRLGKLRSGVNADRAWLTLPRRDEADDHQHGICTVRAAPLRSLYTFQDRRAYALPLDVKSKASSASTSLSRSGVSPILATPPSAVTIGATRAGARSTLGAGLSR